MANDIIDLLQVKIEKAKAALPSETLSAINAIDWQMVVWRMREEKGYNFEQIEALELETELLLCGLLSVKDYPKELKSRMQISEVAVNSLVNEMNEKVFSKIKEELVKNIERKKIFIKKPLAPAPKETFTSSVRSPYATPPLPSAVLDKSDLDTLNLHGIKIADKSVRDEKNMLEEAGMIPPRLSATPQEGNKLPKAELPTLAKTQEVQTEKLELKGEVINPILAQKFFGSVQNKTVQTVHSLDNITKNTSVPIKPAPQPEAKKVYPPNADPYRVMPE